MSRVALAQVAAGLEHRAADLLLATGSPGGSVAIADQGGQEAAFASGHVGGTVLRPEHVVNVGSMAKLYVGVLALRLHENGEVELDAEVAALTGLPLVNPHGGVPVTLRHLLTHTSGLATDTGEARWDVAEDYYAAVLEAGSTREYAGSRGRWAHPTGTRYVYTSFGVGLAGWALGRAVGSTFPALVDRHVLEPLGMTNTAWPGSARWDAVQPQRVSGYLRVGDLLFESPVLRSGSVEGSELVASPRDHLRLLRALWNGGELGGARVLRPESVRELLAPQVAVPPGQVKPGLFGDAEGHVGLSVQLTSTGRPEFYWGHGGGWPCQGWSESRVYPDLGFAIVAVDRRWDALRIIDPADTVFSGIVCDWAARWHLAGAVPAPRPSVRSTWSYATGLLAAERFAAATGAGPLQGEPLERMLDSRVTTKSHLALEPFDLAELRAGVLAMNRTGGDPRAIAALLDDPASRVGREELEVLALLWGGPRARLPVLVPGLTSA